VNDLQGSGGRLYKLSGSSKSLVNGLMNLFAQGTEIRAFKFLNGTEYEKEFSS
jgi:hypothetical protein